MVEEIGRERQRLEGDGPEKCNLEAGEENAGEILTLVGGAEVQDISISESMATSYLVLKNLLCFAALQSLCFLKPFVKTDYMQTLPVSGIKGKSDCVQA